MNNLKLRMTSKKDRGSYQRIIHDDVLNMDKWGSETYAHIQEVYSFFDKDNDGAIATSEVIKVVRSLGHNPTEKEIKFLVEEYDPEGDGIIEFATFLQLLDRVKHHGDSEDDIDEAFRVFDPTGSGIISASEMRTMLTQIGEKLSEEEAEDMIAFADGSSKGEINWKDLMRTLLR